MGARLEVGGVDPVVHGVGCGGGGEFELITIKNDKIIFVDFHYPWAESSFRSTNSSLLVCKNSNLSKLWKIKIREKKLEVVVYFQKELEYSFLTCILTLEDLWLKRRRKQEGGGFHRINGLPENISHISERIDSIYYYWKR